LVNKRFWLSIGLLLLAAVFRFHALGQDVRFHPDEALFMTFARQAAVQGDWLLHGSLDKPPLTIYVNALALTAYGIRPLPDGVLTLDNRSGEFAARVTGVFISLLLVAVLVALAKQLYRGDHRTRYIVSLMMGLSPLAIAFSATAFTDGLMLLCVVIALWMAGRRRWFWAGLWLALGLWSKQQAALYLPLVLAVGWLCERRDQNKLSIAKLLRFIIPIVIGILLLFIWDGARNQATSMWMLATVNNDPGRLARVDELLPRLTEWWHYGQYLFGAGLVTLVLCIVAGVGLGKRLRTSTSSDLWVDVVLAAYVIVYMLVHWLVAINIYDRYLLLILTPLVLLVARGLTRVFQGFRRNIQTLVALLLLAACLPTAWTASQDQLPIGGDGGRHNGIEQVADYLNSQRLGAIVYDHWLGWELGYYMGTWSDKRRVYYPTPQALATDALLQMDPAPRYFVVPDWADATGWLTALQDAKFKVTETYNQSPFVVYELLRP
jgi:4-amino-4-deoxy-L-arabinose transferase-like glycosyltransferase